MNFAKKSKKIFGESKYFLGFRNYFGEIKWRRYMKAKENAWYFVTKIVLTHCEITRTIHSNSERSDQFLVTECFFNQVLLGFRNMQEKLENIISGENLVIPTIVWLLLGISFKTHFFP